MPTKLHNNFGEVLQTQYLPATILELFTEDEDVPVEKWDTAKVQLADGKQLEMPVFYHCGPESRERANGALEDGATGFDVGDEVIVLGTITAGVGAEFEGHSDYFLVAHKDRPQRCKPGWVVLLATSDASGFEETWCSIFNIRTGQVLHKQKPMPEVEEGEPEPDPEYYEFPCTLAEAEPVLDMYVQKDEAGEYLWEDEELFTWMPQNPEEGMQIAGGTPNWMDDFQGEAIRGGTPAKDWWNSYDAFGNPTYNFFWNAQLALLTDSTGVAEGSFAKSQAIADTFPEQGWSGPGVVQDARNYWVSARGVDGAERMPAMSQHYQVGYGEDEIWVCARNTWLGMVVSYCDASWKYIRFVTMPGYIDNANLALAALAGTAALMAPLGGAGVGLMLGTVGLALAASMFSSTSGIWTFATLKRINEGAYHRTSYPAMGTYGMLSPGSWALYQNPIKGDKETIPAITALNTRLERVSAWVRYDNWHNTLQYSGAMDEADRTWFFRVWSTQTMYDNYYLDTPLGSMFYGAPWQRSVLWWMYGLSFSTADLTARQDWPIKTRHWFVSQHNSRALFQMYIVHRQGITMEGLQKDTEGRFWIQEAIKTPWECLPDPDILDEDIPEPEGLPGILMPPTSDYAGYVEDGTVHVATLTESEIADLVDDLVFVHSGSSSQPNPLRSNRNEIEIMAAADMYGKLKDRTGGKRPQDQERNPELEQAIEDLIAMAITESGQTGYGLPDYDLEAHLL